MNEGEYTDSYQAEHPELIPENPEEARNLVAAAIEAGIETCDITTFLRAWWAFAWLNPGFHPDDCDQWHELPHAKELTDEALRRAGNGEFAGDSEFYAAEATHNAVWLKRAGNLNAPTP